MNARQANRAARRAQARAAQNPRGKAILAPATREGREKRLEEIVRQCEDEARKAGIRYTYEAIYAAVLLAARELYGFGAKRGIRLLRRADEIATTTICTADAVRAVWEKLGIELRFDEGVDRIQEREGKA